METAAARLRKNRVRRLTVGASRKVTRIAMATGIKTLRAR
jgi:hypothetical protein